MALRSQFVERSANVVAWKSALIRVVYVSKEKEGLDMFKPKIYWVGILTLLWFPCLSIAQQAETPIHKDGDWWRVKVDVARPAGVSIAGPQLGGFPEYIVKFDSAKPKVVGVRGDESKETDSSAIVALVLGRSGWRGDLLRFPMRVGLTWTDRFQYQPRGKQLAWEEGRYEVQAWEKVKTLKGEFDAFKIVMNMSVPTGPRGKGTSLRTTTYYYPPEIKAIVSFQETGTEANVASTLIDFNLGK